MVGMGDEDRAAAAEPAHRRRAGLTVTACAVGAAAIVVVAAALTGAGRDGARAASTTPTASTTGPAVLASTTPTSTPTTRPAPTVPKNVAELAQDREVVAAELAGHPEWPQREISSNGKVLLMPFGPHDPQAYLNWLDDVGWQYRTVQRVYTPGPDDPSLQALDAIRDRLWEEIRALDVPRQTLVVTVDFDSATVHADYTAPAPPELLAVFERAKATYGDRFTYSPVSDPGWFASDGTMPSTP